MNGKDLMVGMSFVDEKFIQEAETKQIRKSKLSFFNKYISIAACFVILIGTAIGIASLKETALPVTQPPGSIEMVPEESDAFLLDMDLIHNNTIDGIGGNDVGYDPTVYDVRSWNAAEISAYYGKDLRPAYVPAGLTASSYNDHAEPVYTKDGAVVSDLVTLGFYTGFYEDGSPELFEETGYVKGISIQAAKVGELATCLYLEPETNRQTTDISGTDVTFGVQHISGNVPELYTAEFRSGGIQYLVVGWQIQQEEVLKVVASIIRGDANISIIQ
ncbi:hypothetical protein [Acutalibacter intestini]|uniref:hypothetical protein n=1 Tax=Acutalibacter intestini TaxID=3093659 RepID=UPI002AC9098D|nr:hypothetical protein [Acutalibacter sp. M00204]